MRFSRIAATLLLGFFGAPSAQANAFKILSPLAGSDLHDSEVVLTLTGCEASKKGEAPYFRILLDGSEAPFRLLGALDKRGNQDWWLQFTVPEETEIGKHRVTVEGTCDGKARSDSISFTFRERGVLETVEGLARSFRAKNRSDRAEWNLPHGLVAWGMSEIANLNQDAEADLLRDWVEGYHRGWASRDSEDRALKAPMDVLPAVSGLRSVFESNNAAVRARLEDAVQFLETAPRTSLGLLDRRGIAWWRQALPPGVAADELLGYAVFATQWGVYSNHAELLDHGARAPGILAQKLLDQNDGLFRQIWLEKKDRARNEGKLYNLRTQAGVLFAIVSILDALPRNHPETASLSSLARELSQSVLRHQLPSGAWALYTGDRSSDSDETSTTALMGAALAKGVRVGALSPITLLSVRLAWSHLMGRVSSVGADVKSLPVYSIDRVAPWPNTSRGPSCLKENLPHAVGGVLLFASELQRLGGFQRSLGSRLRRMAWE